MIFLLENALAARPFVPVTVVTSKGESVVIEDRESAAVLTKAGMLYVELPGEKEPRFLNLRQIKEVRTAPMQPGDSRAEAVSKA